MKRLLFVILFFVTNSISAQKLDFSSCVGAVQLSPNMPYSLKFTGKKGIDKTNLYGYLNKITVSKNAIWTKFEPGKNGKLQVKCKSEIDSFHIVIFKTGVGTTCLDFNTKKAEPLFIKVKTNCSQLENVFLDLNEGNEYVIVFIAPEKNKQSVDFELVFTPKDLKGEDFVDTLTMNLVYSQQKPIYSIHIVDDKTNKPITARITISSQSEIDGTYFASDLLMNLTKSLKNCTIKVDAEGYNSKDYSNYKISSVKHTADTFKLEALKRGSVAKLDEIYFAPGLAVILEDSYPRLLRLRDFLVLNPQISIEIQGHVNKDKKHGMSSMRLSKKRAMKILDFLVESGIDPLRLSAVGYGNSKPVYPSPKNEAEKEANRRVEILLK